MESKNINFRQYKQAAFTKLQKKLIICAFIVSLACLVMEAVMYCTLVAIDEPEASDLTYIIFKLILPNVFNISSVIAAYLVWRSNRYELETKSLFVSFCVFVISSVIAIVHNYFSILLVAPAFSFVISSVFGDKKILRILGICTVPVFILEGVTFFLDPECGPYIYRTLTLSCSFIFILIAFIFANTLVVTTANQLSYIHQSYQTQSLLIEELKIEPLTKLYNRTAFDNTVNRIIRRAAEEDITPFMVVIDIDFFKKVNDEYGHTSGDKVLIRLAGIIKSNMGGPRQAFRYGGEEFVLIFEDHKREVVHNCVEQIRADFENSSYTFAPDLTITLSAGISDYKHEYSGKDWFNSADSALYESKSLGRNQVRFFDGK